MERVSTRPSYIGLAFVAALTVALIAATGSYVAASVGGAIGGVILLCTGFLAILSVFYWVDSHIRSWLKYAEENEVEI